MSSKITISDLSGPTYVCSFTSTDDQLMVDLNEVLKQNNSYSIFTPAVKETLSIRYQVRQFGQMFVASLYNADVVVQVSHACIKAALSHLPQHASTLSDNPVIMNVIEVRGAGIISSL